MSKVFDAASLEQRYAFLDECPESLIHEVVTSPVGTLAERVSGVRRWRDALVAGRMPQLDGWPSPEIGKPILCALAEMKLVPFCSNQPELVDALLKDILSALTKQTELFRSTVAERLKQLEELERIRLNQLEEALAKKKKRPLKLIKLDDETLQRLRTQAERELLRNIDNNKDDSLISAWGERARVWSEISDVFGDLGAMLGRGWDFSLGVLRHTGWHDLIKLKKLIENLPQIREIVRSLGRLHESENDLSTAEKIFVPTTRLEEERRDVQTPHAPAEVRGVERSGDIARMLPVEASMLGHSTLRLLWHARRAERSLLTYRVEGSEIEKILIEREEQEEVERRRPRPVRGPIIAVIDTSGSMHGLPETVAKAVVFEAVRIAHSEKRKCYLYSYSGAGQILEHELDLSPNGISQLLEFLSFTFGGGTDIGAMNTVVERLQQDTWIKADVILVTDGEWSAPTKIINGVKSAKENGTRFHGVQIGNRSRSGLHDICDPVHIFQDWIALGG